MVSASSGDALPLGERLALAAEHPLFLHEDRRRVGAVAGGLVARAGPAARVITESGGREAAGRRGRQAHAPGGGGVERLPRPDRPG